VFHAKVSGPGPAPAPVQNIAFGQRLSRQHLSWNCSVHSPRGKQRAAIRRAIGPGPRCSPWGEARVAFQI